MSPEDWEYYERREGKAAQMLGYVMAAWLFIGTTALGYWIVRWLAE